MGNFVRTHFVIFRHLSKRGLDITIVVRHKKQIEKELGNSVRGKSLIQFFRYIHFKYLIGLITTSPTRGLKCSHLRSVLATSRTFVIEHSETIGLTGTDLIRYAKRHSKHVCGSIFFFAILQICFYAN